MANLFGTSCIGVKRQNGPQGFFLINLFKSKLVSVLAWELKWAGTATWSMQCYRGIDFDPKCWCKEMDAVMCNHRYVPVFPIFPPQGSAITRWEPQTPFDILK